MALKDMKTKLKRPGIVGNRGTVAIQVTDFVESKDGIKGVMGIPISLREDKREEVFVRLQTIDELVNNEIFLRRQRGQAQDEIDADKPTFKAAIEKMVAKRDADVHMHTFNDQSHNNFVGVGGVFMLENCLEKLTSAKTTVLAGRWASFLATAEQLQKGEKRLIMNLPVQVSGTDDEENPRRSLTIAHTHDAVRVTEKEGLKAALMDCFAKDWKAMVRVADATEAEGIIRDNIVRDEDQKPVRAEGRALRDTPEDASNAFLEEFDGFITEALAQDDLVFEVVPFEPMYAGAKTVEVSAKGGNKMRLKDYMVADGTEPFGNVLSSARTFGFRNSVVVAKTEKLGTDEAYEIAILARPLGTGYRVYPTANLSTEFIQPYELMDAAKKVAGNNQSQTTNTANQQQTAGQKPSGQTTKANADTTAAAAKDSTQSAAQTKTAPVDSGVDLDGIDAALNSDSSFDLDNIPSAGAGM